MNRKWNYHLFDDGGVSLCENQEILLPIGTLFRHEYGIYKVTAYLNDKLEGETRYTFITNVECDRVSSNKTIINKIRKNNEQQPNTSNN